ncbi:hypothetical protein [Curtobacterium sp. USHLN213]|uniref:hypothetical protein n=1 Tax=Curtobacterium sp. USHLN213 TaxID=3081255 RepID=UPI003018D8DB
MSEPVRTDTLRALAQQSPSFDEFDEWYDDVKSSLAAAADEVDRLRLSDSNAIQQRDQLADALRRSDSENDRLRAAIDGAPHNENCGHVDWVDGVLQLGDCTCWKADAL